MKKPNERHQSIGEQLSMLVSELTNAVLTRERWLRDPDDNNKRSFVDHPLQHAGLLSDLEDAMLPAQLPVDEPGRSSTPASRPPVRHEALELVADITAGAAKLRRELLGSKGRQRGDTSTTAADLREIVGLIDQADPVTQKRVLGEVRSWVYAARVIVSHDAPVLTLRDTCCPYCGGDLRVRSDASSDVWCSGLARVSWCTVADHIEHKRLEPTDCADESGRRRLWPRSSWLMLLDRMEANA